MAKDRKETFMCSDAMADLVGRVAFDADRSKSEVIRACILLSIDTVRSIPSLTNRISIDDRKDHESNAR